MLGRLVGRELDMRWYCSFEGISVMEGMMKMEELGNLDPRAVFK
jgi:hypothetical protein